MDDQIITSFDEEGANELLSNTTDGLQGVIENSTGPIKIKINWDVVGGSIEFVEEDNIIRLKELDIKTDVCLDVDFDLSDVLPDVGIPSVCIDTGFFEFCTPAIEIDWPSIQFNICLPTIVSEISADFFLDVVKDESDWVIKGSINLFTLDIDPIDIADTIAQLFEDSIKEKLQSIPLVGVIVGDATTTILASILDLPDDIGEFITTMISDELNLHDIFSVGIDLHRQNECLEFMKSTNIDSSVKVKILKLSSEIENNELIVKIKLGDSC